MNIWILIAFLAGGLVGMVLMSLCAIAARADREAERAFREREKA